MAPTETVIAPVATKAEKASDDESTAGSSTSAEDTPNKGPSGLHQRRHWSGETPTADKAPTEKSALGGTAGDLQRCPMAEFVMPKEYLTHPGGQTHLSTAQREKETAGILFLTYHAGADMNGKVAQAARTAGIAVPERGKMYDEMHAAIRKVKRNHSVMQWWFRAYCLLITACLVVGFFWWFYDPGLFNTSINAIAFELYMLNVFHTRHHQGGQIYSNELLHRLTTPLYDFVDCTWGYVHFAWVVNHHVKHHVYTNDTGTDTDVPSMYPYVRSCADQPRLWFHKLQTFYWPLLMPFTAVNFPVNNILVHGGKMFHFASWLFIMFLAPWMAHGNRGVALSLFMQSVAGASLAYKFAISHAHNDLRSTTAQQETYEDIDKWIAAQTEEAISYGGWWTTFIFGGINMQIEHHIAPALDPPLYYYIGPEIARISRKYGVNYTMEPSFFHAVWQFHLKLWQMGCA